MLVLKSLLGIFSYVSPEGGRYNFLPEVTPRQWTNTAKKKNLEENMKKRQLVILLIACILWGIPSVTREAQAQVAAETQVLASRPTVYIPTNITTYTLKAYTGIPLKLEGSVSPSYATYQDITWTITGTNTIGASIVNNVFTAEEAGSVYLRSAVNYPGTESSSYSVLFYFSVVDYEPGMPTTPDKYYPTNTTVGDDVPPVLPPQPSTEPSASAPNIYPIVGVNLNHPSQEQIAKYYLDSIAQLDGVATTFATQPSTVAPYSLGAISAESQQMGVDITNFIRYVAGLNYNVVWDQEKADSLQAISLVSALHRTLSHRPTQPSGLSDELYALAVAGQSSNLSSGYNNLFRNIVHGWMADEDESNRSTLAHRAAFLTKGMSGVTFGRVSTYSAMTCTTDYYEQSTSQGIAWPAHNMPINLYSTDYPWSFSYEPIEDSVAITVTLTRLNDGKEWFFSDNELESDGFYRSSFSNKVIFVPNVPGVHGDVYHVQVNGGATASYMVNFFNVTAVDTSGVTSLTPVSNASTYEYLPAPDTSYLEGASSWATALITEAYQLGLLEDLDDVMKKYQEDITREEFCRLIMNVYESTGKTAPSGSNPFTDTVHPDVISAYHLGIVAGKTQTTFVPTAPITRQELAVMTMKTAEHYTTISGLSTNLSFTDGDNVADWAKESVFYGQREGFLAGSDGKIRPEENLSCQEAIVVALRLAQKF